jgi:hypothetical protein
MSEGHASAPNEWTISTALSAAAIGGIVATGALILAPHVLPWVGIGNAETATTATSLLHQSTGIAGTINEGLAALPLIGSKLAEGGFFNAVVTGIIGVGGVVLGDSIGQKENGETAITWGKFIKYAALATSALIAMPTVLTALGSGMIYLSILADPIVTFGDTVFSSQIATLVNNTIGTMAGLNHTMMGLSGIAAAIPHFITCGASLLPAALSVKLWRDDKQEAALAPYDYPRHGYSFIAKNKHGIPMPPEDKNHYMTPREAALVERYNDAKPAQKILLKKEILAQGYDPDFHADGTVHLHKHTHDQHHAGMGR